mmetsp:Transcript_40919/g.95052  ORF Transcript_40919/g.95052 Transcript_40919/m.95052 type:complete len:312 (+) Transcript_40919:451-1386(+)
MEEVRKGVLRHLQKEGVVRQGRDRDANLCEVVKVLQNRRVLKIDAMVDTVCQKEGGGEVVDLSSLAGVRSVGEVPGAPQLLAQVVPPADVDEDIVGVVGVGRVFAYRPKLRAQDVGAVHGTHLLAVELRASHGELVWHALIVHAVHPRDRRKHFREVRMRARIQRCLKERLEDVVQQLLEVLHEPLLAKHAEDPRDLNHPQVPVRRRGQMQRVGLQPSRKRVPLLEAASVDGEPHLGVGVVALIAMDDGLSQLTKISALDVIGALQEHGPKVGAAEGAVGIVEVVKPMIEMIVRHGPQGIDMQICIEMLGF